MVRFCAALWAWRERARCDAERVGMRFKAFSAAWERRRDVVDRVARLAVVERRVAERFGAAERLDVERFDELERFAELERFVDFERLAGLDRVAELERFVGLERFVELVRDDDLRFDGRDLLPRLSGMSTPARRASDRPIAIACFAFFAPCLPARMRSISSFTNSPACVLADFPARLSRRARSMVAFSGICGFLC